MKLYVDLTTTRSFELDNVSEADILAALAVQNISYQDGETLDEMIERVQGTLPGELAFAALVGDVEPVDHSETWSLIDWDDDE